VRATLIITTNGGIGNRHRPEGGVAVARGLLWGLGVQITGEILEPAVHRHRHHRMPGADLARELQRGHDVEPGRRAGEEAFLPGTRSGLSLRPSLFRTPGRAPHPSMLRRFSTATASLHTIRQRYPFAAHTNAREMPVLPPVYSTTVMPGFRSPRRSARSTID